MFNELKNIPEAWFKAFSSQSFRNQLIITLMVLIAVAAYNFHYLREWQLRDGTQINDLVLNFLPPQDFSAPIFLLEYCTVIIVLVFTLPHPGKLVQGFQMIILIVFARTWCVYLLPLEPPKDMILLKDPLADLFLHSRTIFVTKDLFFSGHISILALLVFISSNKYIKYVAIAATILVSEMILWQHVHYSIDIMFAPVVSFISYKLVLFLHRKSSFGLDRERNNPGAKVDIGKTS